MVEKLSDGTHGIQLGSRPVDFGFCIVPVADEPQAAHDLVVAYPAHGEVVALAIFDPVELAGVFEAPIGPSVSQMHAFIIGPAVKGAL